MEVNLIEENNSFKIKFSLDNENYIYKNNLMDFLADGFTLDKIFYPQNIIISSYSIYAQILLSVVKQSTYSLYTKIYCLCLYNWILKRKDKPFDSSILSDNMSDLKEFHGILYDLAYYAIKNVENRYMYFEDYYKKADLSNYDNPILKARVIFNPFEYTITDKEKNLPIDFSTISSLCFFELQEMLYLYKKPKLCKYCNKYFISNKSNQVYCNRLQSNGKTCFEIGNSKKYKNDLFTKKTNNDKILAEYMRAYRKIYKNKYNNADRKLMSEDIEKLKQIKYALEMVRSLSMSEEEYYEFLKNINKKKE